MAVESPPTLSVESLVSLSFLRSLLDLVEAGSKKVVEREKLK